MPDLTDTEKKLLDIYGKAWTYAGNREAAILAATGLSATRGAQIINRLINTEAALAYAPLTVKRLQRIRDGKRSRPLRSV